MTLVREWLAGSSFLVFPQMALVLFFAIFVAVLVAAHRMRRGGPALDRLARLPLQDDDPVTDLHAAEGSGR